ncbi:MAG: hypothetical protein ACK4NQ_01325 [Fimbriimonadaceae bacterium]
MLEDGVKPIEERRAFGVSLHIGSEGTEELGITLEREPTSGHQALQTASSLQKPQQDIDAITLRPVRWIESLRLF